ncbi:MAG: peptidoglycan-binding protein, partial [Magnetovibrio sp.]|nr:peptidoglycan-binding protein [Magnetovibrio sp.]
MFIALGMIGAVHTTWAASVSPRSAAYLENLATFETAAGAALDSQEPRRLSAASNVVRRIQESLADEGFYLGPIDGRYGPQIGAAIRAYQKSADLKVDGQATERLAKDLETGGQVSKLLGRLEDSRKKSTAAARDALLANPDTRNLIIGAEAAAQGAPHDSKACMANPEPRCLLIEASASARDIDKPEMRDWALGEILTAQARAGFADDAALTTR